MKRRVLILLAGCLSGIPAVHAQELPSQSSRFLPPVTAPASLRLPIPEFRTAPLWQPEKAFGTAQARPSVLRQDGAKIRQRRKRELNREASLWRATIGNTSMNNWSPYPDRGLDARTLRFPLPRKPQTQQLKK